MDSFPTYIRRCYALLSRDDRRRWLRLIPLVALTSAIEAVGTVAVFVLVASLTDPDAVLDSPFVGPVISQIVGEERDMVGVVLVIAVAIFYLSKSAVVAATEYAQATAAAYTAANLSVRMVTAYLRAPYLFHVGRNATDLVHTATVGAGTTFGNVVSAMLHIVTEVLVFTAILTVLFMAAPWMTVAATAILLLVGALFWVVQRRSSSRLGALAQQLGITSMRQQAQALSAVDEIAVLGRSTHFIESFADLADRLAYVGARSRFISSLPRITIETLFIFGALFATVGLLVTGESSARTVSLLGLFAYAGFRIIPSANRILMHVYTVRFGEAGVERICDDLAEIETDDAQPAVDPDWDFRREVSFRSVALSYPEHPADVLSDVDLVIRRGESLAIVGETGSGKSSLIRMLVGLVPPTRGKIAIDDVDLSAVLPSWRRRLGYVPQEVHLVEDSLRRNIAFGIADREIDESAVVRAIERAQLGKFVAGLPDGLDSRVGDRGVRLSGGERQRVGIARAFYHGPHVLILDEATSSLDAGTEAEVLEELRSGLDRWTVIAVTHRVSSVRGFDRIVFVDGGRVSAIGTYDELALDVEAFRKIVQIGESE